jgi:hypothetical protein
MVRGAGVMTPLARLATASLLAGAAMALPSTPAHATDTLQRPVQSAALLPLPDLPVPEVSAPSLPEPEVSVPQPPAVPDVPDVHDAPEPAVSAPELSSPQQPAPRETQQGEQGGTHTQDGQAAARSTASGDRVTGQGAGAGRPGARPVIAQVDHAQGARAFNNLDDYLLGLVHDKLCAALPALLHPMPKTVDGLPPRVIAQLPPEIVNVVPEPVLARATVRCAAQEPAGAEDDGPLTRVLGMHPHTGMLGAAALPIGLGLLSLGLGLRVTARPGVRKPA